VMTIFIIDMTLAVSNLLLKSLLTSPAYRQAGFSKGRLSPSPFDNLFPAKGRQRGIEGDLY